mmetsp:Transcript_83067/g.121649  ORF Transcript_83067/g.121649 Transcript_83067/m.121649 type:complete len:200 (-) Transcript_83067:598-1197(-)
MLRLQLVAYNVHLEINPRLIASFLLPVLPLPPFVPRDCCFFQIAHLPRELLLIVLLVRLGRIIVLAILGRAYHGFDHVAPSQQLPKVAFPENTQVKKAIGDFLVRFFVFQQCLVFLAIGKEHNFIVVGQHLNSILGAHKVGCRDFLVQERDASFISIAVLLGVVFLQHVSFFGGAEVELFKHVLWVQQFGVNLFGRQIS